MKESCIKIFGILTGIFVVIAFASLGLAQTYAGKKVLYIDSYHEGYEWSDGIQRGVQEGFKGSGVELKTIHLDTKRNGSEEFKKEAGAKAKQEIETFKPDLVIASDDNASKYVIVPYFKDSDLPFVFCGVDWDASPYGFPSKNVTGMLEVTEITGLAQLLGKVSKGDRIGFIADDTETNHKVIEYYKKLYNLEPVPYFAKDFEDFKKGFVELQGKVDSMIFYGWAAIKDWKMDEASDFVLKNTKVPTGTFQEEVMPFVTIGYLKIPEEQGSWSAEAALKIFGGTKPLDIPIAKNQTGKVMLNAKIAEKAGIQFPYEVTQSAAKIIE
jgi:ABC-type uncharacterized transport system substrate-binding protein